MSTKIACKSERSGHFEIKVKGRRALDKYVDTSLKPVTSHRIIGYIRSIIRRDGTENEQNTWPGWSAWLRVQPVLFLSTSLHKAWLYASPPRSVLRIAGDLYVSTIHRRGGGAAAEDSLSPWQAPRNGKRTRQDGVGPAV